MALTINQSASGLTRDTTVVFSGDVTQYSPTNHIASLSAVYLTDQDITYAQFNPDPPNADGYILSGTWSYTANGLADGTHMFQVFSYDSYDGLQANQAATITVDTTPPKLTAGQSASGTTASTGIVLSGTASDANGVGAVEIMDTSGATWTDLGPATISGNTWQLTVAHLAPGAHNFIAIATDAAGNTAMASTGGTVTVATTSALKPAILRIIGNTDGGVTLLGTAVPGVMVAISDTSAGITRSLGTVTAAADGSFRLVSHIRGSTAAVNTYTAIATDASGRTGASLGTVQLASSAADTLSGTIGQSDVFATFLRTGNDTINGFETTAAVGAAHDVINLSGTGYAMWSQLASHITGTTAAVIQLDATRSVTLTGISAASLQSSDFRFS